MSHSNFVTDFTKDPGVPRRFGKSVMAGMLSAYYSKGYEGREIFKGLKISLKEKIGDDKNAKAQNKSNARNVEYEADDSYLEYLNKFDVIHIDMNSIKGRYEDYLKKQRVEGVSNMVDFLQYTVVSDLMKNAEFTDILKEHKIGSLELYGALRVLNECLNIRFIFIMDEWDLVYRDYRDDSEIQKQFIDLLRRLFKSDEGLRCFSLVYLTGILPIKKENSESALNNFRDFNMLSPGKYEEYFGFTDEEIQTLVQSPECRLSYQELKKWYDGYKLNDIDIYNPNSVITAIDFKRCANYWRGTSALDEALRLINLNYEGLKEDLILLLDGQQIKFNCAGFQNDMKSFQSKDDVLSLLACLGYLGCVAADNGAGENKKKSVNDDSDDGDVDIRIAYVPNREIRMTLKYLIDLENWLRIDEIIRPSEELFDAICALNGEKEAEMIGKIHNSPDISLLGYNSEEALVYCVISALIWKTHGLYQIRREEQGGKGRTDLIYEPNADMPNLPILVIELKYNHSAREAIDQIKRERYYSRYLDDAYYNEILLLGINYDSKTKEHECLIEKVERS